ncbi:MAG TPA: hypothetical protein VL137_04280 [Polyangiaceae bacterium]|nr:hypothetical protein [Polyangiaceae bacterium]
MTPSRLLPAVAAGMYLLMATSHKVNANLPANAINEVSMPLYGIYTTSDPLCQTGLVATLPIKSQPTLTNLAESPTLGTGPLPEHGIACVVIVAQDRFMLGWSAGTYTGTSHFGTSTFDDANCNAGGSEGPLMMCNDSPLAPTWPAQILDDLAAAGIAPAMDCSGAGDGTLAVPLYLSTAAKCVGEVVADTAIGGACDWSLNTNVTPEGYRSNTLSQAPTQLDDPLHGAHIDALPAGLTHFKFIADPTPTLGGNGSNSCGGLNPPRFSFVPLDSDN